MPSGLTVEIAEAKTSSETKVNNDSSNCLLRFWFFFSHFSVTKILEGEFPDLSNSSIGWVPSIQKKSFSLREDPLLNDLNLLTRLLFLLVIFKKVFSMSNLKMRYQLYFNYINILINYLLNFYFPRNQKKNIFTFN